MNISVNFGSLKFLTESCSNSRGFYSGERIDSVSILSVTKTVVLAVGQGLSETHGSR